jgi:Flp pilus assembly pilin Flp
MKDFSVRGFDAFDKLTASWAHPKELLRDRRGTVTVEYVVVLMLVALGVVAAMAGLGVPLVRTYLSQTAWLIAPFP